VGEEENGEKETDAWGGVAQMTAAAGKYSKFEQIASHSLRVIRPT